LLDDETEAEGVDDTYSVMYLRSHPLIQVSFMTRSYPNGSHIPLVPALSVARMADRDPNGNFTTLSLSDKRKLAYRSDYGVYGPNNELVEFENLPDVLAPGNLVIVDLNTF
jgi:hypothetical protein